MAKSTTSTGGIAAAMAAICEDYAREIDESLLEDVTAAGDVTAEAARSKSPKDTGKYASGWTSTIEQDGLGGVSAIIHNKTKPALTHLLEKGHMNRGGGWTSARVHIEPAYQIGAAELEKRVHG